MIQIVHDKVPGRTRFKFQGGSLSNSGIRLLESELIKFHDIHRVTASATTGNILVFYNSYNDCDTIAALIEGAIKKIPADTFPRDAAVSGAGRGKKPAASKKRTAKITELDGTKKSVGNNGQQASFFKSTPPDWHMAAISTVIKKTRSTAETGLTKAEFRQRIKRYGPNTLPETDARSPLNIFFDQINSLPNYLLGAAAAVSIATGGIFDALVIGGVVVANAIIGFATENKAEKTIYSLKNMVRPIAEVFRDGKIREVPVEEVVIGDLLNLKPGIYVAADCRIVEAANLSIDESMLTGESMPVFKAESPIKNRSTPLSNRKNMAYMGTLVVGGQGRAIVVATGSSTEIGQLQFLLGNTSSPKTPIERQLGHMGDQLVILCGAICGFVFLIGTLRGYGFMQMLRMAISLAAAAVPEGLPAAATINFAMGINHMRRRRVLVRHLQAIETLGAVQTVCLDKTGTITQNCMSVTKIFSGEKSIAFGSGTLAVDDASIDPAAFEEISRLLKVCVLCNEVKINGNGHGPLDLSGSPTEKALIHLAADLGNDVQALQSAYRLLEIHHRSENRLFMSTLHRSADGTTLFSLKGSPYEVLSLCSRQIVNNQCIPLTDRDKLRIEQENDHMSAESLRVLGFAYKTVGTDDAEAGENDLIWLGLVGMADPIRDGVKDLIPVFHHAGIDTVMITGDQSSTAHAVAEQLNLSGGKPLEILDSSELVSVDPDTLIALAKKAHVYSRVSPAHKLKIVQALQSAGKVVAMTGDGINDGPALKAADIGIAMGQSGTDIAREVANVVLEDDNLEILTVALRDGRATYGNIRKSVHFFLSTNLSEILVMFAAMGLGIGFPLNVMQLLWINIISDIFPGLALSMEDAEPDIMDRKPRDPYAPLFSPKDIKRMAYESAVISGSALGAYGYGILRYGVGSQATSMAFQSLTIGQLIHAISCRSETKSIFKGQRTAANKYLNIAVGGSLAVQLLTMAFPPLRRILGLAAPNLTDLAVIGASSVLPFIVNESTK